MIQINAIKFQIIRKITSILMVMFLLNYHSIIIVLVISISIGQSQSVIKKNEIWEDEKSVFLWDSTMPFPKLENIPRIPNIEYLLVYNVPQNLDRQDN